MARRTSHVFLLFLACTLLPAIGCHSVAISRATWNSLDAVSIQLEVEETASFSRGLPGVEVDTPGAAWYSTWFTAPIGAAVDVATASDTRGRRSNALIRRLQSNDIVVPQLVVEEFYAGLQSRSPPFRVLRKGSDDPSDARFLLAVDHGLGNGWGVRGTWRPYVTVEATLVDREGKVLWRHEAEVKQSDERVLDVDYPFYRTGRLKKGYRQAVHLAVKELVNDLP